MTVTIHHGDCRAVLATMAEESVDSGVCDPPYHLTSIVKRFGSPDAAPAKEGATGAYARASRGFMGKSWDGGDVAFQPETWAAVLRVMKPGAHLVAFGGTRTYHRMACAIEDAGFEVRDTLAWLYASGFPKSHNIGKAIDKEAGHERAKVRIDAAHVRNPKATGAGRDGSEGATRPWIEAAMARGYHEAASPEAASPEAAAWEGWGTALKPPFEPIILARKPFRGTVAANVLAHGTGALNVDGCRVATDESLNGGAYSNGAKDLSKATSYATGVAAGEFKQPAGRWPANVLHDGSDEVVGAFPESRGQLRAVTGAERSHRTKHAFGEFGRSDGGMEPRADSGSAARFFFSAKADASDRLGSRHPTVKPVDLMRWLVRLVTPPGGLVLDPFAGTGITGMAALMESMRAVLIEREAEYVADINRRLAHMKGGDAPLFAEPPAKPPDPLDIPDFLRRA